MKTTTNLRTAVLMAVLFFSLPFGEGWGGAAFAQTTFQHGFEPLNRYAGAMGLRQTTDSGFIMPLVTQTTVAPVVHGIGLLKTDKSGNITWSKTFEAPDNYFDVGYYGVLPTTDNLQQTSDSGYIVVASLKSNGGNDQIDGFVLKTDKAGVVEWFKRIGRANFQDQLLSVQQTTDGGYILTGLTASYGSGGFNTATNNLPGNEATDVWLIKLSSSGIVEWSKTYGNRNINEYGFQVIQTQDGGFVIAGNVTDSVNTYIGAGYDTCAGGGQSGLMLKTDDKGNLLWSKKYSVPDGSSVNQCSRATFYSFGKTADKGFVMAGNAHRDPGGAVGGVAWLLKLDSIGNNQWNYTYDTYLNDAGRSSSTVAQNVYQEKDKGYVFTSGKNNIVRTDSSGNVVWRKQYGSMFVDPTRFMIPVKEGGYALAGGGNMFLESVNDVILVKADTDGNCGGCENTLCTLPEMFSPVLTVTTLTLFVATGISVAPVSYTPVDLLVQDTIGCFTDTSSVTADFYVQSLCLGDSTGFINGSTEASLFNWSFGDPSSGTADTSTLRNPPKHLYPATGTYTVTLIAVRPFNCDTAAGFSDTIVKTVTIFDKFTTMNAGTDVTICSGASTILSATGHKNFYNWAPFDGSVDFNSVATTKANPTITTTYYAFGDDGNCSAKDSVVVTVLPDPNAAITGKDSICTGSSALLSASGTGTYLWSTGTTASFITVNPVLNTNYWLAVFDGFCTDTAKTTVTVLSNPVINAGEDVTVDYGNSVVLTVAGNGIYEWSWSPQEGLSCTDCSSPVAAPEITTVYYVTVTDIYGCENTDSITVLVLIPCGNIEVFVPNAFSPNKDNVNDVLYLKTKADCIEQLEFKIYDRWGNRVFESNKLSDSWDGTYKGYAMDAAVFAYHLTATSTSGETIMQKGNISLIR